MSTLEQNPPSVEAFKALGDPVRWNIVNQVAAVDELPCATLEHTLPVSKPTISYHCKILQQAGILAVRKQGRNYLYSLRREVLNELLEELWELAPSPRPIESGAGPVVRFRRDSTSTRIRASRTDREGRGRRVAGDNDVVVLTW